MSRYYSLLQAHSDMGRCSGVICIIKIKKNADIYDYLTQIYIDYKNSENTVEIPGGLEHFCERLDLLLEDKLSQEYSFDELKKLISLDLQVDDFDPIIIESHKLIKIK